MRENEPNCAATALETGKLKRLLHVVAVRWRPKPPRSVASNKKRESQAVPPPEPQPAERCHPSYDPCLDPSSSDYDCEGGSGDGPDYTGPVTVTGSDDYDLDSDDSGTGCEP